MKSILIYLLAYLCSHIYDCSNTAIESSYSADSSIQSSRDLSALKAFDLTSQKNRAHFASITKTLQLKNKIAIYNSLSEYQQEITKAMEKTNPDISKYKKYLLYFQSQIRTCFEKQDSLAEQIAAAKETAKLAQIELNIIQNELALFLQVVKTYGTLHNFHYLASFYDRQSMLTSTYEQAKERSGQATLALEQLEKAYNSLSAKIIELKRMMQKWKDEIVALKQWRTGIAKEKHFLKRKLQKVIESLSKLRRDEEKARQKSYDAEMRFKTFEMEMNDEKEKQSQIGDKFIFE